MENKKLAQFLLYLNKKIGLKISEQVKLAVNSSSEDSSLTKEFTEQLLSAIHSMNSRQLELVVYAKNKQARDLASCINSIIGIKIENNF